MPAGATHAAVLGDAAQGFCGDIRPSCSYTCPHRLLPSCQVSPWLTVHVSLPLPCGDGTSCPLAATPTPSSPPGVCGLLWIISISKVDESVCERRMCLDNAFLHAGRHLSIHQATLKIRKTTTKHQQSACSSTLDSARLCWSPVQAQIWICSSEGRMTA